jgi:hypothetical protein
MQHPSNKYGQPQLSNKAGMVCPAKRKTPEMKAEQGAICHAQRKLVAPYGKIDMRSAANCSAWSMQNRRSKQKETQAG